MTVESNGYTVTLTRNQLLALGKAASALRFASTDEWYTKSAKDELREIAATLTEIENKVLQTSSNVP